MWTYKKATIAITMENNQLVQCVDLCTYVEFWKKTTIHGLFQNT